MLAPTETSENAVIPGASGSGRDYYGPSSLEERIAEADVIAKVKLCSVSSGVDLHDDGGTGDTAYVITLEYRFAVLEYLKGSGGSELVAVAYDPTRRYETREAATASGVDLRDQRHTQWDNREAIIFLGDAVPWLPSSREANRYRFGTAYGGEDYYTIVSPYNKGWLPEELVNGATGSAGMQGDNQRFLLDVPSSVSSRDTGSRAASTRSGEAPTITLAALKERIAAIEDEVNAGDGSEKYQDCIYYKYKWEREVRWTLDRLGGKYYYIPHNRDIASGLPAGSDVHTDKFANSTIREYGETDPGDLGEHRIVGRDENLFSVRWPGVVFSVRPLLAGEYKYYFGYLPEESVVCDGIPEQEMQRQEVFVHVTAPAGTLHEAFFDPTAIGAAVGADTTNGALTPTALTVEGTATTV